MFITATGQKQSLIVPEVSRAVSVNAFGGKHLLDHDLDLDVAFDLDLDLDEDEDHDQIMAKSSRSSRRRTSWKVKKVSATLDCQVTLTNVSQLLAARSSL